MKTLIITPDGWGCSLGECPPGFFVFEEQLCFKTEYTSIRSNNKFEIEVYCFSVEFFVGGEKDYEEKLKLIVQPVITKWEEES